MIRRITPEEIKNLKKNEIFVFGSNEAGIHGAGAARTALKWGAKPGKGYGYNGKTYAIPTKDWNIRVLPLEFIEEYVEYFIKFVKENTNKNFLVTKIGCGLAGYTVKEIAPMFKECIELNNVFLPSEFWEELEKHDNTNN